MRTVDEIIADQKKLEKELEDAMKAQRDAVLVDIKEKIKMFNFTSADFKGIFKGRVSKKQVEEYIRKQEEAKNKKSKKDETNSG